MTTTTVNRVPSQRNAARARRTEHAAAVPAVPGTERSETTHVMVRRPAAENAAQNKSDPDACTVHAFATCSIAGCFGLAKAHGWCSKHHQRWLRWGDPLKTLTTRFVPKFRGRVA